MLTIIFTVIAMYVVFNYILKPMAGYLTPLETSGRLCLQEQLRIYGIDPKILPRACLEDFVANAIKIAKFSSKFGGGAIHSELINTLDIRAEIIAHQLTNPKSIAIDDNCISKETFDLLQRHRLINFP
jgi:hypothetical protein